MPLSIFFCLFMPLELYWHWEGTKTGNEGAARTDSGL